MKYLKYLRKEVRTITYIKKKNKKCVLYQKTNQTETKCGKRTKSLTKKVKQREVQMNKANLQHWAAGDACGC